MGRSQRVKGHNFERRVAALFRAAFPDVAVRRGRQSHGGEDPDVLVGLALPRYDVECKATKMTPHPRQPMKQVLSTLRPGAVPLVVMKDDRVPPTVTLRLADFLALVGTARKTAADLEAAADLELHLEDEG